MSSRILVMGLSGSGKTTYCKSILLMFDHFKWPVLYLNADDIREKYGDWDFSLEGRLRQAKRMYDLAKPFSGIVIADFIAPLPECRKLYQPTFIVWMDTINKCCYSDTNDLFIAPRHYDVRITKYEQ